MFAGKHLLGIYAAVNQVTLRPKETIDMFVTLSDLVSTFWEIWVSQTLQICGSSLNRLKKENKKMKKDKKRTEKQNFLALGNLASSSNKVFIEA